MALHRLEPIDGKVLHMAGQTPGEFSSYSNSLPEDIRPLAYSSYLPLVRLNETGAGVRWFRHLKQILRKLGNTNHVVLPHLAVSLKPPPHGESVRDHNPIPRLVNDGAYDTAIAELVAGLQLMNLPVFLRVGESYQNNTCRKLRFEKIFSLSCMLTCVTLGYEFNGRWNNYDAAEYVQSWRRIERAIAAATDTAADTAAATGIDKDDGTAQSSNNRPRGEATPTRASTRASTLRERVALVWDMTCDVRGARTNPWPYYPGSKY